MVAKPDVRKIIVLVLILVVDLKKMTECRDKSCDELFAEYRAIKEQVMANIHDPNVIMKQLWSTWFTNDEMCNCLFSEHHQQSTSIVRRKFLCRECHAFKRLLPIPSFGQHSLVIECGQNVGKRYVVSPTGYVDLRMELQSRSYVKFFFSSYVVPTLLAVDSHTLAVLANVILQSLLSVTGPAMVTTFICHGGSMLLTADEGIMLDQLANNKRYIQADKKALRGLWLQLVSTWKELSKKAATWYYPSAAQWKVIEVPCSYLYQGIPIEGPLTLRLADITPTNLVALTISDKYRLASFCERLPESSITTEMKPLPTQPYTITSRVVVEDGINFLIARSCGLELAPIVDLYCWTIALLSSCWDELRHDTELFLIWRSMWLPNQAPDLSTIKEPFSAIPGRSLDPNVADRLLNSIH